MPVATLLAEWRLARVRLFRTRLGFWLCVIGLVPAALAAHPWAPAPPVVAIYAAMLAAACAVTFLVASAADRAALDMVLSHPTSPGAIAWGRWLAATCVAGAVGAAAGVAALRAHPEPAPAALLALVALAAAAATAGCALAAALLGGGLPVAALFLYVTLLGAFGPDELERILAPGPWRTFAIIAATVLPAPWRYEALAHGNAEAWLHVLAWSAGGVSGGWLRLVAARPGAGTWQRLS